MKKIAITLALLLWPGLALASGIQVTPSKLEFTGNKSETQELVVANPTGDVALFEIYADDYDKDIKANPESFTLEAGERKKVAIRVDLGKLSGTVTTNLSIVSKPLADSKVKVNTGVKIPITITSAGTNIYKFLVPAIVGALIVATGLIYFFKFRKRKSAASGLHDPIG